MFYLIGIGLSPNQITLEAKEAIKESKQVYIDNYTNKLSQGKIKDLEEIINKKITILNREELEQKKDYIKNNCCLLVIGNPLSATTHYTVINDAKNNKLKVKVIPGISIFNYRGVSGLFEYKFGKTISIVYPVKNYFPTSYFNTIIENIKCKAHTLCLLDIKVDENRYMSILEACEILEKIDDNKILKDKVIVGLGAMGSSTERVITFDFKNYKKIKIKEQPQAMIICGKLNEYEKEAINEYRCYRILWKVQKTS